MVAQLEKLYGLVEEITAYPGLTDVTFVMTIVNTLQSVIDCSTRVVKLAQNDKKANEKDTSAAGTIVSSLSSKLAQTAYKFLARDWCPVDMRAELRAKYKYKVDDVGVLVQAYLHHSTESDENINSMLPTEVRDAELSAVS